PSLDDGVAVADRRGLVAYLRDRNGLRRRERDLHAALEVDAEVQALEDQRDDADADRRQGEDEPQPAAPDDVPALPLRDLERARAHEARVVEPLEAGEEAEHRARGRD